MSELREYKYVVAWGDGWHGGDGRIDNRSQKEPTWTEIFVESAYSVDEGRKQLEVKLQEAIFQRDNGLVAGPIYAQNRWAAIVAMWPTEAEIIDPKHYPPQRYRELEAK